MRYAGRPCEAQALNPFLFTDYYSIFFILEKQDLNKAERLLQALKNTWSVKCKETENLRLSLKHSNDEHSLTSTEYKQMKDSIHNMRKQFGEAVDSSVNDIEELSIVNSNLSEKITELEAKIEGAEKYFK